MDEILNEVIVSGIINVIGNIKEVMILDIIK